MSRSDRFNPLPRLSRNLQLQKDVSTIRTGLMLSANPTNTSHSASTAISVSALSWHVWKRS